MTVSFSQPNNTDSNGQTYYTCPANTTCIADLSQMQKGTTQTVIELGKNSKVIVQNDDKNANYRDSFFTEPGQLTNGNGTFFKFNGGHFNIFDKAQVQTPNKIWKSGFFSGAR